ncbi:(2Fe-2S)-binding protein [Kolteria novifilia]
MRSSSTTTCGRNCQTCPAQLVCHCLRVSKDDVLDVIVNGIAQTSDDVRRLTGAGGGCMACRQKVKAMILEHSPSATDRARPSVTVDSSLVQPT